jgi:glyoxylase-like metal-dependent hydrolase (beta-lactamase superfamily II)
LSGELLKRPPAIHQRRIGDIVVTTLLDGYIDVQPEVFLNIDATDLGDTLERAHCARTPRITVNAYLVRSGGRVALVEAGTGASLGPTLGWLLDNLAAAGVSASDIDTVLLTHMHPDHSNGLTAADGSLSFPNAQLRLHEDERSHWLNDGRKNQAQGRQVLYFDTARARLRAYERQVATFTGGEVFPGVFAEPIPGHTPGHTSYRISSGGESMLIWGDIVHKPEIQIPRPEVSTTMDTDPLLAISTRRRVLDMAATDRLLVAGMHIGFPGYAHIERHAEGYRFHPAGWALES